MSENKNTKERTFMFAPAKGCDTAISVATTLLMIFGFFMVLSANMGSAVNGSVEGKVSLLNSKMIMTIIKEFVFLGAGYAALVFFSHRFRMKQLKGNMFMMVILATFAALLLCLFFPSMGGAHAWIGIPRGSGYLVSLQPSEFAKIVCILTVAAYLGDREKRYRADRTFWIKPVSFILIMVLIVAILQDDFGSAAVIFVISCVCMLIPDHVNMKNLQLTLRICFWICVVLAGVLLFTSFGNELIQDLPLAQYQIDRILVSKNPFKDPYGTGYHVINGLVAMATGGVFGQGFGNSVRKYTQFPAADTDFILAITIEELGFVGFLIIFVLYMIIIVQLLRYAQKVRSEKAKIILVGTAMYFLVHMILNIGGATGFIPLTGVPLLLISAGGSSTMAALIALGISQGVIAQHNRGTLK